MYAEQHKGESIIMGWFYNNVDKIYNARWNFLGNILDGTEIRHDRRKYIFSYRSGDRRKIVNSVELTDVQKQEVDNF